MYVVDAMVTFVIQETVENNAIVAYKMVIYFVADALVFAENVGLGPALDVNVCAS